MIGMDTETALKWEKKRTMGKTKYVIGYGAIGLGLSVAILLTLIEWASEKRINASWVLIRSLVFPLIGSLISNVRWSNQENKWFEYQETLK
jgi:hypothetical protein